MPHAQPVIADPHQNVIVRNVLLDRLGFPLNHRQHVPEDQKGGR